MRAPAVKRFTAVIVGCWIAAAGAAAPAKPSRSITVPAPAVTPSTAAPAVSPSATSGTAIPTTPFAEIIDKNNFDKVAVRGMHAIGGIGDWALGNGVVCATISAPQHETYLSTRGGALIDLGHCGRGDDLWNAMHPLFNMSKDQVMHFDSVHAEHDADSAKIIASGSSNGVAIRNEYRVDLANANTLFIDTKLTRQQKSSTRLFLFGLLSLHPSRSLAPFSLSLTAPEYNKGYAHPPLDTGNIRSVVSAMQPSEWQILVGGESTAPISYGWGIVKAEHIDANSKAEPLPLFAFNNQEMTMFGLFSEPLLFGHRKPGMLEFAQTLWMNLPVGESLHIEQRIVLGERADVATITDHLYSGNWLRGRVDNKNVRIAIDSANDDNNRTPLTEIEPDSDGAFSARLPAGATKVKLRISGNGIADNEIIAAADQPDNDIGLIAVAHPATIVLPRGAPMLLVFKGIDGTPDPVLFDDGKHFKVGDNYFYPALASNKVSLAGIDTDFRHIALAPGRYRVLATRGPFYSVTETTIEAIAGAVQYLGIDAPQQVVDRRGWISADLHVHSGYSFDSDLSLQQRLTQLIAQDCDVFVSTEHNRSVDYRAQIEAMGLQNKIVAIGGSEMTGIAHGPNAPRTMGHANIFPIEAKANEFLGGLPAHENMTLGDVIGAVKKAYPATFFQLNHPRSGDRDADMAFFNHLDRGEYAFDATQTLEHTHNSALLKKRDSGYRDIDFDGMELLNGSALDAYATVRNDWFALLRQGFIKVATANSDSHSSKEIVALPRNLLRLDDDLASFDTQKFIAALKAGKVVGSTGPLLDMTLNGVGLGEIFRGDSGTLKVHVDAAPWIAVDNVSVYVNGKLLQTVPISAGETREFAMTFSESSFITAEVHGVPTAQYRDIAPGVTPMAFTNPIFVLPEK